MGKRSGIPHRDEELKKLDSKQLRADLNSSRSRLNIAPSAKMAKLWQKRIDWLEAEIARRD